LWLFKMGCCVTNNTNQLQCGGDTIQIWTRLHQWSTSKLQMKSIKYKLIVEYGKKTYSWSYKYVAKMYKIVVGRLTCHQHAKLGAQCELGFGFWNIIKQMTNLWRMQLVGGVGTIRTRPCQTMVVLTMSNHTVMNMWSHLRGTQESFKHQIHQSCIRILDSISCSHCAKH
jgi:hypothetical protein